MKIDLNELFAHLRPLLAAYEPYFTVRVDEPKRYELWSEKDLVIEGRKKKAVFFAGLIIQKSYVGFYFMPVYVETELKEVFDPLLLKMLKGKSCFYIKQWTPEIKAAIESALEKGFRLYQERGWV